MAEPTASPDFSKIRRNVRRMIDGGAASDEIEYYLKLEQVTPDEIRQGFREKDLDQTGAPASLRYKAGSAARPEDALATVQKEYPDARMLESGSIVFTNPATGKPTLLNPSGPDVGDIASIAPEAGGVAGGLAGAALGAKAGAAVGSLGGPVGAGVGGLLGAVVGGGIGSAGGEELARIPARSMGAVDTRTKKEVAQDMAVNAALGGAGELVGPLATAGVKGALRGTVRNPQTAQEAVRAFNAVGSSPTAEQIVRPSASMLIKGTSLFPGGMAARISAQAQQDAEISAFANTLASRMSGGAEIGPVASGVAVKSGITNDFIPAFKAQSAKEFDAARQMANGIVVGLPQTMDTVSKLLNPTKGKAINKVIASDKIKMLTDAIKSDVKDATKAGAAGLDFETVDAIRSAIGRALGDTAELESAPRGQLKLLFSAISDDMETSLAASGRLDALEAFQKARSNYTRGREVIDNFLQPLVDTQVPERVFSVLNNSMKEGPTRISTVIKALDEQQLGVLRASVIQRAGRPPGFNQDATGEIWRLDTFLTRWEGFDPKAKDVLFPPSNEFRKSLDDLASAASVARKATRTAANPSGTAQAFTNVQGLEAMTRAGMDGNATVAAKTFAALYAAPYLTVKLLNRPWFVRSVANSTKVSPAGFGAWAGQLWAQSKGEDEQTRAEIRDFIANIGNSIIGDNRP